MAPKRHADKAAAPVRKTLRYSQDGQTNETFGPRELFRAQQSTSMRKRPYAVEEEEILEIQDLKRDSALDSMENSILKIEDCFEEATTFNKHTNTAQFYS